MRRIEGSTKEEGAEERKENEKLREVIAEIFREEVEEIMQGANEAIREIVSAEFLPMLRSAVRESILKELEEVVYHTQTAIAKEKAKEKEVVASVAAISEDEETITSEAGVDQGLGLYLYGIADTDAQTELGEIGIEENKVYTIPYKELAAIVHDSPLEPYNSDDEEVVKGWVTAHQQVLEIAEERFGTVIPFGFDTIIKPEDKVPAKDVLNEWMAEELDSLKEKLERIRGKKEYGVQIFYIPPVMSERIVSESEEISKIKDEMDSKGPGVAYMYKQKLEIAIKKEMESRMDSYFRDFYGRIKKHVEETRVEKTKRTDEKDRQMIMNLSCLVANDTYKALGVVLEEIDKEEGFSVRFTGPWPAYSFV